jgi:hypothetical protein
MLGRMEGAGQRADSFPALRAYRSAGIQTQPLGKYVHLSSHEDPEP